MNALKLVLAIEHVAPFISRPLSHSPMLSFTISAEFRYGE